MALTKGCCKSWIELAGMIMPFHRCIALEYGYGDYKQIGTMPVAGIVQCGQCKSCYHYALCGQSRDVAAWWFARMAAAALDQIIRSYSDIKSPKWPIWVPPSGLKSDQEAKVKEVEDTVFTHVEAPRFILTSKNIITGRVITATSFTKGYHALE